MKNGGVLLHKVRATVEDNCNTANATARALARKIDASREASMHGAEAEEGEREDDAERGWGRSEQPEEAGKAEEAEEAHTETRRKGAQRKHQGKMKCTLMIPAAER